MSAIAHRSSGKAKAKPFISGYLEGYYGRLLSFEERLGIVAKLKDIGAGHYLYAPKEDPFHRQEWRAPYPTPWRRDFRRFVLDARRLGVRVMPGMAPGLSYRYRRAEDFEALEAKLRAFAAMGCEEAVLLMDDIPAELPKADAGAFRSLGEAHNKLLRRLQEKLCRPGGLKRLWFCPTVYSDYFARDGVEVDPYLRDLAAGFPEDVEWLWTGPAIVSKSLAPREFAPVARLMGRKPVLWDNLYANDYCPGRIFLGPFRERPASLRRASAGLLLNPTGLYHTDLFLLDLLGGFLRGENAQSTWKSALRSREVPKGFDAIAPLLASPFDMANPRLWTRDKVVAMRKALKPLIWDWKSPLQREWYSYLYMLDADFRLLLRGEELPDAPWVRKKYSPIVSHILLENPLLQG